MWKGVKVKGGRVEEVDWSDEGLTGTIPAELGSSTASDSCILVAEGWIAIATRFAATCPPISAS